MSAAAAAGGAPASEGEATAWTWPPPAGLPPLRHAPYAPPAGPLRVIHADARLLVVDKPAGLLTVPGKGAALADCLASRAEAAFPGARIVHRLDRDTSGVVVLARDADAQRHLGLQFERRRIAKTYLAEAAGVPPAAGRLSLALRADWPARPRQMPDPEGGRAAETAWRVLSADPGAPPRGRARLRLSPRTGRSHQLRVHLAALGHPILGDPIYADDAAFAAADRLRLHAETLTLRHPDGGAEASFAAPCPF